MDTQYCTTTTSTSVLALEEYQDIPSKHINGDRDKFSEVASRLVDIDLKLISMLSGRLSGKIVVVMKTAGSIRLHTKSTTFRRGITICLFMNADTTSSPDVSRRCKPGAKTASRLLMSPILTAGYGQGIWPG